MNSLSFWCDAAALSGVIRRAPPGIAFKENGTPRDFYFQYKSSDSVVFVILSRGLDAEHDLKDHDDGDDALEVAVRSVAKRPVSMYLYTSQVALCRDMMLVMLNDPSIVVSTGGNGVWRGDEFVRALRLCPRWAWWRDPRPRGLPPRSSR